MRRTVATKSIATGTLQIVLSLLFVLTGGMKVVVPAEVLTKDTTLPVLFLRLIGALELLGAAGLLLPLVYRARERLAVLAPLAALGLVCIMIGATSVTLIGPHPAQAMVPLITGVLLLVLAYSRRAALLAAVARGAPQSDHDVAMPR